MNKSHQSGNTSFRSDAMPSNVHQYEGFWAKTCMLLGSVHVIVAVLCFVMNGIGIHFHAHMHHYAQGMWGGAVFFVTGFICVFAGFYKTPIPVKIAMVASIVTILVAIPIMGITAAGLDHDRKINFSYWIKDDFTGQSYLDGKESFRKSAHAMLLALSLLELVVGGLTLAVTAHATFYCNTYKGASQSPGNAMMFPKSSSPVPPEINMSATKQSVSGYPYGDHNTSVTSGVPVSPVDVNLSQRSPHDTSTDSGLPQPSVVSSAAPSAFQQYPATAKQPSPAPVEPQPPTSSVRGPPQPQVPHTRAADQSHSSLDTTTGSKRKGPKLQVPHNRHNTSTSSVETTGSGRRRGPQIQQPHQRHDGSLQQRHDVSYSSVDSYPSVQSGGVGYPPPVRSSSRSSNPAPYNQQQYERNMHPARAFEGFSQPGYSDRQQGGYPQARHDRV